VEKVVDDFLRALSEKDDEQTEAAAARFAALPAKQAGDVLEELAGLLASPELDTRWWATRAMAASSSSLATGYLTRALGDEHASVRQCAALGLRIHPDAQSVPSLVAALSDPDGLVARLASDALVRIGEPAVQFLLDVLGNGARSARLEAVRALAYIGDQRSLPALYAILDEESALMEYWAIEGLERMGVGMLLFSPD
jgi:HEAT repeat protein